MEHFLASILGQTHGLIAYAVVFAILLLCGLGLPLPEDITLILGGYLAYSKAVRADVMVVVCFCGILCGDSTIFVMGRRLGRNLNPQSWIGRLVTTEKLAKVEQLFARWGQKIVMAARFMPGVRAGVYFAAGASGLAYWRFIIFDSLAACVSAPLLVLGARHFGGEITHFIMMARRAQLTVFMTLAGTALAYTLLYRARRQRELDAARTAPAPSQLHQEPQGIGRERTGS
jgi:membrane protein DedA with SNARE-associated domain